MLAESGFVRCCMKRGIEDDMIEAKWLGARRCGSNVSLW